MPYCAYTYGTKSPILFSAVSGRNENGKFDYSIEKQKIPKIGPIPEGEYWIQPSEIEKNSFYKLRGRTGWGDYWVTIHPYPNTDSYKRGGFFIHGGKNPGSAGCIDLTSQMSRFVGALQKELEGKPNCHIPLTVRYRK